MNLVLSKVSISTESCSPNKFYKWICHDFPIKCERCGGNEFGIFETPLSRECEFRAYCCDADCKNKRWCEIEERKRIDEKNLWEEQERKRKEISGAKKFDLGNEYENANLSKWIARACTHEHVLNWLTNERPFFVFMGNPGVGKTYLSAAILNYLDEKGDNVFYTTHRRFIERIHKSIEDGKAQMESIDRISEVKFLIFDDLGSATCTEWQQEMILELIDRRYSKNLKTLITTNLDEKKIQDKLGRRTASRLLDVKNSKLCLWAEDNRMNIDFLEQYRK